MTRTGGSGRLPRSHAPRRLLPVATIAVAFLPLDGHAAIGTQTRGGTLDLDDLERLAVISEVALSPDGRTVLFRRLDPVSEGVGWRGSLWGVAADGGEPVPLLENASGARWAPDGDRFAFLRATESGAQVWLAGSSGRESRPLTAYPGGVLDYAWAPDGTAIAFVAVAGEDAGDRAGSAQLFVQGVEDDAARRLTEVAGDVHTAFFGGGSALSWSPDGATIAFAMQEGRSFEDVYGADIHLVAVAGGPARPLVRREGMDILPRFSPDGGRVAFVTSFGAIDRLATHGLAVVDIETGRVADVGRAVDAAFLDAPSDPMWSRDGGRLYVTRASGTTRELFSLAVPGGDLERLTRLGGVASGLSLSGDGSRFAFLASTPAHPFEVFVSPVAGPDPVRLTHTNPHLEALDLPAMRTVRWRSVDGEALEGVLIVPDTRPAAIVAWMHGGPEGHAVSAFDPTLPFPGVAFDPFPLRLLAARGYAVFAPNFRGSAGYGLAHRRAAVPAPAARAAGDLLSGIDALADSGWVDPDRAAIVGWASGALKVANVLTRTDRFRAAVFGGGQTELFSAFGEGDAVVQWRSLYGGAPWEVPERYRSESPLLSAGGVSTPTLLLHGERDPLVPVDQTRQFHTYLALRGVPTDLVVVPGEGHGIIHPERRSEVARRVIAWLDRWLDIGEPAGVEPDGAASQGTR